MKMQLTRRRFISLIATAGAGICLPYSPAAAERSGHLYRWRGIVMGAEAGFQLYHPEYGEAEHLVKQCLAEILRLEKIFSLYEPTSFTARLNRHGYVENAPTEFTELLQHAHRFSALTHGAFDVTVQPLWELYHTHFSESQADTNGPSAEALNEVLRHVDYRAIIIEGNGVRFDKPDMKITLNGIAQGYITDRITELLKRQGVERVLVELGETRALKAHPDHGPWRIGLKNPSSPEEISDVIEIENRALATSGGYGMAFDPQHKHHHLIDPRTGKSATHYASVSILAANATTADALSTGLSMLPQDKAEDILKTLPDTEGIFITL